MMGLPAWSLCQLLLLPFPQAALDCCPFVITSNFTPEKVDRIRWENGWTKDRKAFGFADKHLTLGWQAIRISECV